MVALSMLGLVIALVGAVWLLVITFKTSVLWGLGSLFIPDCESGIRGNALG